MKNNVLVQSKVPLEVKEGAEKVLNELGLDLSTAIRIFLAKVKSSQSIPFIVGLDSYEMSKALSDYLLSVKHDIEQDKDILHFSSNQEGFDYLTGLMK